MVWLWLGFIPNGGPLHAHRNRSRHCAAAALSDCIAAHLLATIGPQTLGMLAKLPSDELLEMTISALEKAGETPAMQAEAQIELHKENLNYGARAESCRREVGPRV